MRPRFKKPGKKRSQEIMTTDEFILKAKANEDSWVEAGAVGGFFASHALRWYKGRLYHLSFVDGVSQRESIRYFKKCYANATWRLHGISFTQRGGRA